MRNQQKRSAQRSARYERFEDRLALTAQAVASLLADDALQPPPLQQFGDVQPIAPPLQTFGSPEQVAPPPLEQFGDYDFYLSDAVERVEQALDEVDSLLNEAHEQTGVDFVHDTYGFDGSTQTVAVIDTGIAYDHYALGAGFGSNYRVVGGWDFAENDADPYDDGPAGFHGTHVAGIVGSDNSTYTGVASDVDLVALRVFDDNGAGYFSWVESALQWVHDHRDDFDSPITTVNLSLGAEWNSDSVPSWANLEDEFAQLEADGIFISVAAGNSFTNYNAAGLSYPGASPYVVPVSSIDSNGLMSYFSQRNDRVLAAPGRSIASTVPDYVFGADGNPNDFGSASGTSMAAPYVAGAAVLVREAMEFAGQSNITQDVIYDHLRDTADIFFDAATSANYHRINLESALQALMPSDDYGSTAGAAHSLGSVSANANLAGTVGQLNDVDYFTFTAAVSGEATFTASNQTHDLTARFALVGGGGQNNGNTFAFDVTAGQTYTIALDSSAGVGHYDLGLDIQAAMDDLGTVSFTHLQNQNWGGAGEKGFMLTSSQAGQFTAETMFQHVNGNVDLELLNSSMQVVDSSSGTGDSERVDATVAAGDTLYVRIVGANANVGLRLTNLVNTSGATMTFTGTSGNDAFVGDAQQMSFSINGVTYQAGGGVTQVNFDGNGGHDTFTLQGTSGNENATMRPDSVDVSGDGFGVHGEDLESASLNGGGGYDNVTLYDSAGDDLFVAEPGYSYMSGDGFYNYASGFHGVYSYATAGGNDTVYMYDSAGDDTFAGLSDYAYISGNGFMTYAHSFEAVYANATRGGNDVAYFYDSAGNDRFVSRPEYAYLTGDGFYNFAGGFDQVNAYATAGGNNDRAYFYDSAGDDLFVGRTDYAYMSGDGYYNLASGFDRAWGYATAGGTNDRAYLYDSAGDDRFFGRHDHAILTGDGFYNYAGGFDSVRAYATTGANDRAYLYDSVGADRFFGRENYSYMTGAGFYNYANGFDGVQAYALNGGANDRAYLYDSSGNDTFYGRTNYAYLTGGGFYNSAQGFDVATGYATNGGTDQATFDNLGNGDTLYGRDNLARADSGDEQSQAYMFDSVTAQAIAGENPDADVDALDYVFQQLGDWAE